MTEQSQEIEASEAVEEVIDDQPGHPDEQPSADAAAQAPIDPALLERQLEAVLMSIDRPATAARLGEILGTKDAKAITAAVKSLNAFYDQHERAFRIEQVAGGYQILTLPQYKDLIASMHKAKDDTKLSPAALETLAIIAYKQPMMRADIETIRGVSCGEVLRALMDRHLIKIVGRAEELGRPMLYGTTRTFLQVFGLASLKDLPKGGELNKQ